MDTTTNQSAEPAPLQLLLIGPMPIPNDHIGGAKAAFAQMHEELTSMSMVNVSLINLSRPLSSAGATKKLYLNLLGLIHTLARIAKMGRHNDVWALNLSPNGSFTLLPLVMVLAKLFSKPVLLRMFGGSFHEDRTKLGPIRKYIYDKSINACSVVTMETKQLIKDTHYFNNIKWFPNTRNNLMTPVDKDQCNNMLFLSQIRKEKGVGEIIDAMPQLTQNINIDFYGSVVDDNLIKRIEQTPNLHYKGELQPEDVYDVLRHYDALLLPTYWQGEGLPGVIVEAFQSGLPVIASDWKQIPELVTHEHDGLLIKPKCSASLAVAIDRFVACEDDYRMFSVNAINTGNDYRSDKWTTTFYHWCLDAHNQHSRQDDREQR